MTTKLTIKIQMKTKYSTIMFQKKNTRSTFSTSKEISNSKLTSQHRLRCSSQ